MDLNDLRELPTKLSKEPLVDVVFEMRFSSKMSASSVLPGLIFSKFKELGLDVQRLPIGDLPAEIRERDNSVRYQATVRLHGREFVFLVGDRVAGVACKIPYVGWSAFKKQIMSTFEVVRDSGVVESFERFSFKYVDLIPGNTTREQIERLDMDVRVGPYEVQNESFNVRLQVTEEGVTHLVNIAAPASASIPPAHKKTSGILIDIDSICVLNGMNIDMIDKELPDLLERVHKDNKLMFFKCITEDTLKYLEPVYE